MFGQHRGLSCLGDNLICTSIFRYDSGTGHYIVLVKCIDVHSLSACQSQWRLRLDHVSIDTRA